MTKKKVEESHCEKYILALRDTLNVTNGKWKLSIVCCLIDDKKRFTDIQKIIGTITPRMLSKELKELEINGVVSRNVVNSTPVLIEYELTPSGKSLFQVVVKMVEWGIEHRKSIISK